VSKFFDALQEKSSRDEYGDPLGRLVCFHLRQSEQKLAPWNEVYPLTAAQEASLDDFSLVLGSENGKAIMELFLQEETDHLLEEMACPVQHFLICASRGEGL
jgi:hypothetical protein